MTFIETMLGGIAVAGISAMLATILNGRKKLDKDDFDGHLEDFEKHRSSDNPHIACPVHKKQLDDVEKKIDKMDGKIDKLLSRN